MTIKYTKEQLNKFDKDLLIELFLGMQGQMEELSRQTQALNDRMQLMMEQMVLFQKNRFGRSSEKMADSEQIRFMEVDGTIVFFNEAEAVCDLDAPEPDDLELKAPKKKKQPGKTAHTYTHAIPHSAAWPLPDAAPASLIMVRTDNTVRCHDLFL